MSEGERPYKPGQFKRGDPNNPAKRREETGSGRRKGTPNKFTTVKNAVLTAFEELGGESYLLRLARSRKDRGHFVQLLGKCIPQEVTGKDGGPIEIELTQIATVGLARLDDAEVVEFMRLLDKMGVRDPMLVGEDPANDEASTPLLAGPEKEAAA